MRYITKEIIRKTKELKKYKSIYKRKINTPKTIILTKDLNKDERLGEIKQKNKKSLMINL